MQQWQCTLIRLTILLLLAGCNVKSEVSNQSGTKVATPYWEFVPTGTPRVTNQLHEAEERWTTLNITNYHIRVSFYENFANNLESERDIVVNEGEIVKSACTSAQCPMFVLDDVYTINDLFAVAKGSTLVHMRTPDMPMHEYNDCVQELSFDKDYGFPKSMTIDCPDAYDEDHSFRVTLFEVLK